MALEARKIYFRYDPKQPWILEDCTLRVDRGECLAVFAPSGYGKTTLAMLLAGYLRPARGEILLNGRPLPSKGICPVQLVCQHPEKAVNPRWRLRRVLEESGMLQEDMLEAFGIQRAWLGRFPGELSGGELQRFCVARALMSGADYLVCDEISTMLDLITQSQIWSFLVREVEERGIGLLAVSHSTPLLQQVCTRVEDLEKC